MLNGNVSLTVVIHGQKSAHEAREYVSPVDHQTYVEGRQGSNFTLRIRNGTARRVLAVPSVDGLSVLDGKPASANSSGYILNPHQTLEIPGWKLDGETAAKFFFAGETEAGDESYVAQIGGDVANKGVIGVIVFDEKPSRPVFRHPPAMMMASRGEGMKGVMRSAPSSNSLSPSAAPEGATAQSLGAGFGESTGFATRTAQFDRGGRIATLLIHYDDARGLKRVGIDVSRPASRPSAFPADDVGCTPPAGWKRG